MLRLTLLMAALPVLTQLSGCAVAAATTFLSGTLIANDQRTPGTLVDDEGIKLKVIDTIKSQAGIWEQSNINVTSVNYIVLLTGETPSDAFRAKISQVAAAVEKVRGVHNELVIAAPSSLTSRTSDAWITGMVKTTLISEMQEIGARVKVVTENGTVYLMGLVNSEQAHRATEITRRVEGVKRVVRLFETD